MSRTPVSPENYKDRDCQQFVRDMENAGMAVYHYRGRFYWEGPAVNVHSIQDALSETKVKCQWDNMGLDMVVYPKASSKFCEEAQPLLVKDDVDEDLEDEEDFDDEE